MFLGSEIKKKKSIAAAKVSPSAFLFTYNNLQSRHVRTHRRRRREGAGGCDCGRRLRTGDARREAAPVHERGNAEGRAAGRAGHGADACASDTDGCVTLTP